MNASARNETKAEHLDPWHPDIERQTIDSDIQHNIRYRILRYRMLIDIDVFVIRYRISISTLIDIEGHIPSISKVTKRQFDIEVLNIRLGYRLQILRYRIIISYTISKDFSHTISKVTIGVDIVYHIAFTQCHSLRSGSSLYPGGFTPAPKGLSTTRP